MRRTLSVAWVFLIILNADIGPSHAQVARLGSAASAVTPVAVVNLPKVFESHPDFKNSIAGLQRQTREIEAELNARQKQLAAKNRQLNELQSNSLGFKRLESEVARRAADLQVLARQKRKELMQREALHYYTAYQDIREAVRRVAMQYNISLVLRFESREVDPANLQSVARGMSRAVVYQRDLDITPLVINELCSRVVMKSGAPPRR